MIIKKVKAQSEVDTVGAPSFGPPGDDDTWEPPADDQPTVIADAEISLYSAKDSVNVGEEFSVSLDLATDTNTPRSVTIKVKYDPSSLSVLDSDSITTGIQFSTEDNSFSVTANSVDVTKGEISYSATYTGSQTELSTTLAVITFKAKAAGTTDITISSEGTSVKDASDNNILKSTKDLSLTVNESQTQQTQTQDQELPDAGAWYPTSINLALWGMILVFLAILALMRYSQRRFGE